MTLTPHSLGFTRPGEVDDDTFHGTAYCDHCHETGSTDITRAGYTLTYTCPHCGADNEQAV